MVRRVALTFRRVLPVVIAVALAAAACARPTDAPESDDWRATGRSDPSFRAPSLAPGVDYTVPTAMGIAATLGQVREYLERSTAYRLVDTSPGQPVRNLETASRSVGLDATWGDLNDWTPSMGVVLSGMIRASEVTSDPTFEAYAARNIEFAFAHLDYFRRQAETFGAQPRGFHRLVDMREVEDAGPMTVALIDIYRRSKDPRHRAVIDAAAGFVTRRSSRLPDGTIARGWPEWPTIVADDAFMAVPLLARMGALTGDHAYFDDAALQMSRFLEHLADPVSGLIDHARFMKAGTADPPIHWGRGDASTVVALTELLSLLPESHPRRAELLEAYRRAIRQRLPWQSGAGFWRQLVDRTDSVEETSATALMTYAIARGVARGWLPSSYGAAAQAGWQAVAQRVQRDGQINGITESAVPGYDLVYYYNRPVRTSVLDGYGPVLHAGAEMIAMIEGVEIDRTFDTFHYRPKASSPRTGAPGE
jgi:unsaturated rhamnogalacturonyl hydrolase